MNLVWKSTLAAAFVLMIVLGSAGQEKKIKRSDLPPAVEKTVQAQSEGSKIRGFSEEQEGGKTYYEVELTVNGHEKDVTMDVTGAVTEAEEEVPFDELPPAVKEGLKGKAGTGKMVTVESITKKGRLVAYEAAIVKAGARSEIQIGPDGKPLDHEE